MAGWRESTSQRAQDDLDGLLEATLPFAEQQLRNVGEFFPFAAAVAPDGAVTMVATPMADEQPLSADVIAMLAAALRAGDYRAGVIVSDVRISEGKTDAIQLSLDHIERVSLDVVVPYTLRKFPRKLTLGMMSVSLGRHEIWPQD